MRVVLGWFPECRDPRDHTKSSHWYGEALEMENIQAIGTNKRSVFLNEDGDDLYNIDMVGDDATVARCILSVMDWQMRRNQGESMRRSSLFLHETIKRIHGGGGRSGVGFRMAFKTLKRFGAPPEELVKLGSRLEITNFDSPELYGYASDFASMKYFRFDDENEAPERTIGCIKNWINQGRPCLIGISVPDYIEYVTSLTLPSANTRILGGAPIVLMGYDDHASASSIGKANRGAFLFRSPWGKEWGNSGFGWLPYEFVTNRFAKDCWGIEVGV